MDTTLVCVKDVQPHATASILIAQREMIGHAIFDLDFLEQLAALACVTDAPADDSADDVVAGWYLLESECALRIAR